MLVFILTCTQNSANARIGHGGHAEYDYYPDVRIIETGKNTLLFCRVGGNLPKVEVCKKTTETELEKAKEAQIGYENELENNSEYSHMAIVINLLAILAFILFIAGVISLLFTIGCLSGIRENSSEYGNNKLIFKEFVFGVIFLIVFTTAFVKTMAVSSNKMNRKAEVAKTVFNKHMKGINTWLVDEKS